METQQAEMQEKKEKQSVYDIITSRIIKLLEEGTVPWQKPWADAGLPRNFVSYRYYRGINVWLLSMLGYEHNQFLTFEQAKKLGYSVKEGEHGHVVVFWKQKEKKDGAEKETETTDTKGKKYVLRYYYVFNIVQCEGIPEESLPKKIMRNNDPIEACERIVSNMPDKPAIYHQEHLAFYNPLMDYVNMPKMETFNDSESYYGTLFHELVHAAGHKNRLAREGITNVITTELEPYSIEELIAEIGACYLKSHAGIDGEISNNAAYIQNWLDKLKKDRRFIIFACAAAQKAADFILNRYEAEKEPVGAEANADDELPF